MESSVKQPANTLPAMQQTSSQPTHTLINSLLPKESPILLSSVIGSSGIPDHPYPCTSRVPKPLFLSEFKLSTTGKDETTNKPTHDRQSGSFIPETAVGNSGSIKKPDQVIEIIDEEDKEQHKSLTVTPIIPTVNKQNLKNKQISNHLLSSSTNYKNDSHNLKNNHVFKNDLSLNKNTNKNVKSESWAQKYSFSHSKAQNQDKNTNLAHQKIAQPHTKFPYMGSAQSGPFYNNYLQHRGNSFYDNIFQPQMPGMNFPGGMMNYQANPMLNEPYYWANNNMGRGYNNINPHYPVNSSYNYMYGNNDNMGKGMPFIGGNIDVGQKNMALPNHVNANKTYSTQQTINKDEKALQKQRHHTSLHKQSATNQLVPNRQQKQQINKEIDKKDNTSLVGINDQKKKKPQIIELIDSDDEFVDQKGGGKNINLPNTMHNQHRSMPYTSLNYLVNTPRITAPLNVGTFLQPLNQGYPVNQFQQLPSANHLPPISYAKPMLSQPGHQHSAYHSSKEYKQPAYQFMVEKTKPIHKTHRQSNHYSGKNQSMSDDRNDLAIERLEDLENLQKIKQHRETQQKDLSTLLAHTTAFLENAIGLNKNLMLGIPQVPNSQQSATRLPGSSTYETVMSSDTYWQEKLIDLQNHLGNFRNENNLMDIEQIKVLEQLYNKAGAVLHKFRQGHSLSQENKISNNSSSYDSTLNTNKPTSQTTKNYPSPYPPSKQISGTQHVKRQVQKAFQKTRGRINNQQNNSSKNSTQNKQDRKLLADQKMQSATEEYVKGDSKVKKTKISEKGAGNEEQGKLKDAGWSVGWTPRLRRLREVSRKREYDSAIFVGPDFQAELPAFISDAMQLHQLKAKKRASLLQRMYKSSSQI